MYFFLLFQNIFLLNEQKLQSDGPFLPPFSILSHECALFIKRTAKEHLTSLANIGFYSLYLSLDVYSGNRMKVSTMHVDDRIRKQHYLKTLAYMYFLRAYNRNQLFLPAQYLFLDNRAFIFHLAEPLLFLLVLLDGIACTRGRVSSALASPIGDKIGV